MPGEADYGPLQDIVSGAGFALAATGSIYQMVVGRAKWEPPYQALPSLPRRATATVSAVLIVVLWFLTNGRESKPGWLLPLVIVLALLFLGAAITYFRLYSRYTYPVPVAIGPREVKWERIVAGSELTEESAEHLRKKRVRSEKELLEGAAYDVDLVWTRKSRLRIQTHLLSLYLLVTIAGILALASAGALITP